MKAKITLVDGVLLKVEGTAVEIADLISALRRSHQLGQTDHTVAATYEQTGEIIDEANSEGFSPTGYEDVDVIDIPSLLERKRTGGRLKTGDEDPGVSDTPIAPEIPEPTGDEDSTSPTRWPDPTIRVLANQFRIVAEPTRLRILSILADGGCNVGEICEALGGQSQPAVSHHLGLLRVSGLVTPNREGPFNYYELTDLGRTLAEAVGRLDAPDERKASDLFQQVSDPTRLQILNLLSERERSVSELCTDLGDLSQAAVSHHLARMRPDLIESRREGKFIYSSLRERGEELIRVIGSLLEATGQGDFNRCESPSETEDAGLSTVSDEWSHDVAEDDENEG